MNKIDMHSNKRLKNKSTVKQFLNVLRLRNANRGLSQELKRSIENLEKKNEEINHLKIELDNLQEHINTLNHHITVLQEQNAEKDQHIQIFQESNLLKDKAISDLKRSWSFKIGRTLTKPFGIFYIPQGAKPDSSIKLFFQGFLLLLKKPRELFKQLNFANLKTLFSALKTENPEQIYHNLEKLINSPRESGKIFPSQSDSFLFLQSPVINDQWKSTYKGSDLKINSSNKLRSYNEQYRAYLDKKKLTFSDRERILSEMKYWNFKPVVSIIIHFEKPDVTRIEQSLASIKEQLYPKWEAIIVCNDQNKEIYNHLRSKWALELNNIKITSFVPENSSTTKFLNEAATAAKGTFLTFLQAGDRVSPKALYSLVKTLNIDENIDLVYTDEDEITINGDQLNPFFKPDFNKELLYSYNYIGDFTFVRKELGDKLGWFRESFAEVKMYDLYLRILEKTSNVLHIAAVLYHKMIFKKSGKPSSEDILRKVHTQPNNIPIDNPLKDPLPIGSIKSPKKVQIRFSIIILNKDAPEFIIPIINNLITSDLNDYYEVIVGDTGTTNMDVLSLYETVKNKVTIVRDLKYHFSKNYNYLVQKYAKGELLGIMNNDIIFKNLDFLKSIEKSFFEKDTGVVGGKLLYPNGKLQHAGVFFSEKGPYRGLPFHRLHGHHPKALMGLPIEEVPAVTGAFLFCRKSVFLQIKGFDERFSEEAQDIDLCLKFLRLGKKILYHDFDNIIHVENGTREKGSENWKDRDYFLWKWQSYLEAFVLNSSLNQIESPIHT